MAKVSPVSIKYMIHGNLVAEGALEKPDVIGALFGQTEGLLGSELDMRELQKEGKIGRIEVSLERDSKRENPVGRKVIMDMYNRYLKSTKQEEVQYDPNLPDCIICDIDGTLAIHENRRSPFEYWKAGSDRLNEPVERLLHHIQYSMGIEYNIYTIIMTGRENLCDENGHTISDLTQVWLRKYGINFTDIFIRKEGDHRPDWVVKKEMYEEHIKGQYNVVYVIDDRRQVIDMWREQGLTVLDVAGNDF